MAKEVMYRQCRLQKSLKEGINYYTTWLPEQYAKEGHKVSLRMDGGTWEYNWIVTSVSATRLREDQLPDTHGILGKE